MDLCQSPTWCWWSNELSTAVLHPTTPFHFSRDAPVTNQALLTCNISFRIQEPCETVSEIKNKLKTQGVSRRWESEGVIPRLPAAPKAALPELRQLAGCCCCCGGSASLPCFWHQRLQVSCVLLMGGPSDSKWAKLSGAQHCRDSAAVPLLLQGLGVFLMGKTYSGQLQF